MFQRGDALGALRGADLLLLAGALVVVVQLHQVGVDDPQPRQRTPRSPRPRPAPMSGRAAPGAAARGIDVEDIAAVFNYDIPQDVEYYVHRIGRTGRIGKEGRAFTFVTGRRQIYELRDIERFTKSKITLKAVPSSSEVNETNERKFLDRVRVVLEEGGLEEYTPYTDALLEDYASLDISAALIKMLLKKEQRGRRPSRADDELFAAESRRLSLIHI